MPAPNDWADALVRLTGCPDMASRRWVWEQYDHMVMADTIQRPGGDAAVVRVHGTAKALAISTDCTPRYCFADPREGGKQAIAECWRNITAVGALPLAVTNCLNFASPQRPEIMGQIVGCIEGMAEACRSLDFPVVSGNVSLYNESKSSPDAKGQGVLPTPAIGGVGLLTDYAIMATLAFKAAGDTVILIGDTQGHLGQSLYLRELHGREEGAPPPVDLAAERRNGDLVRSLVADGAVTAVHDVSDGGLASALVDMALASGIGVAAAQPAASDIAAHGFWFGEDQARYVLTARDGEAVLAAARAAGVPATLLGRTQADTSVTLEGLANVPLAELRAAHEGFFPRLMG